MAWLPLTSTTVEPARLDMARWATGGIILSSVATRYQLGLVFHAGSLIVPLSASTPHGTWESAMNAALSASTSAANEAAKLRLVEEQIAVLRGQDRRNGRAGRRILDERRHGLALVRSKGGDIHKPRNLRIVAGFGDHRSAIRVANENRRPVLRSKNALGSRHIVLQRYRRVLDDADVVTVLLQDLVDALPAGAVHKATVDQNDVHTLPSLFRLRQL